MAEPNLTGRWETSDLRWKDPDTNEPPRELVLTLTEDGRASLDSCIVSRVYRTTVDGCFMQETRRDERHLEGSYELVDSVLTFHWTHPDPVLDAYFVKRDDSFCWPTLSLWPLTIDLPTLVMEFRRP